MGGFRFRVEKVFSIPGRGVVVSGKVEEGKVSVDQVIGFLEATGKWKNAVVLAIEVDHRLVEEAEAGGQASLLLDGVKKNQIAIGTLFLEPPQGTVPEEAYEPAPDPSVSARRPPAPKSSAPADISAGRPIHPSSGSWILAALVLAGILIILILLFFQEKINPLKKRVEIESHSEAALSIPGKSSSGLRRLFF